MGQNKVISSLKNNKLNNLNLKEGCFGNPLFLYVKNLLLYKKGLVLYLN